MTVSQTLITSLNNMTVPGSEGGTPMTLMPKLQYRFRVELVGFGTDSSLATKLTTQVIDFTRPNVSFPEIPIEVYNSRIYLAGKATWEAVTLNIRDDAGGQMAKAVGSQLQKQFDFAEQASAAAGKDYKFSLRCDILDGGNGGIAPTVLESWQLTGCYLASANYNSLNYATNEAVTIALSIRYDNAIQYNDDKGTRSAGATIGRTASNATGGITGSAA
jgi:hypothetical protein